VTPKDQDSDFESVVDSLSLAVDESDPDRVEEVESLSLLDAERVADTVSVSDRVTVSVLD